MVMIIPIWETKALRGRVACSTYCPRKPPLDHKGIKPPASLALQVFKMHRAFRQGEKEGSA